MGAQSSSGQAAANLCCPDRDLFHLTIAERRKRRQHINQSANCLPTQALYIYLGT